MANKNDDAARAQEKVTGEDSSGDAQNLAGGVAAGNLIAGAGDSQNLFAGNVAGVNAEHLIAGEGDTQNLVAGNDFIGGGVAVGDAQVVAGGGIAAGGGNEPNQLENSSTLDSIINSLNLVHKPNEPNLS